MVANIILKHYLDLIRNLVADIAHRINSPLMEPDHEFLHERVQELLK